MKATLSAPFRSQIEMRGGRFWITLPESAGVLSGCGMVVAKDTFPTHLNPYKTHTFAYISVGDAIHHVVWLPEEVTI